MRGVADTNIVISGLLWHGPPREVLDAVRRGDLTLSTTGVLLAELQDVLARPKFAERLKCAAVTAEELVLGYAALAPVVQPSLIEPVIADDPDDDAVLACAVAAQAEVIVSGDPHLLLLKEYRGIRIVTAAQLLAELTPRKANRAEPPTSTGNHGKPTGEVQLG
jgi:putative PIN family toxin of toxin-antitoxin system